MNLFGKKTHAEIICFLLLVICAAFSLSYPLAFRTAQTQQLFILGQSYGILTVAQQSPLNVFGAQSLFFANSNLPLPFSLSQIIYSLILHVLPAWALPALLSLLLLCFSWFALRRLSIPLSVKFVSACIFVFSPLFVSSQLSLSHVIFVFIGAVTLLLMLHARVPSWICLVLSFFIGLLGLNVMFAFIMIIILAQPQRGYAPINVQKKYALIGGIIGFISWLALSLATRVSFRDLFTLQPVDRLFVEFGSLHGLTLLTVILAVIGIIITWKRERRWAIVASILLVIWSLLFVASSLIASAIISYFAGQVFVFVWQSRWQHKSLKTVVLTCILISVLASYFIFTQQILNAPPTRPDLSAYMFLQSKTPQNAIVFTSPEQGQLVAYFASRQVLVSDITKSGAYETNFQEYQKILYTQSLSVLLEELANNSISYLFIDPQLQRSQDWRADQGGLSLLLRNKQSFTLVYTGDYLIYRVNYDATNNAQTN